MRELTLLTGGLKYGFQSTTNAKILQQNGFSPSNGGLACSNEGLEPLYPSPGYMLSHQVAAAHFFTYVKLQLVGLLAFSFLSLFLGERH